MSKEQKREKNRRGNVRFDACERYKVATAHKSSLRHRRVKYRNTRKEYYIDLSPVVIVLDDIPKMPNVTLNRRNS